MIPGHGGQMPIDFVFAHHGSAVMGMTSAGGFDVLLAGGGATWPKSALVATTKVTHVTSDPNVIS